MADRLSTNRSRRAIRAARSGKPRPSSTHRDRSLRGSGVRRCPRRRGSRSSSRPPGQPLPELLQGPGLDAEGDRGEVPDDEVERPAEHHAWGERELREVVVQGGQEVLPKRLDVREVEGREQRQPFGQDQVADLAGHPGREVVGERGHATRRRSTERTVWWKIDSRGTASIRSRRCRSLSAWTPRLSRISEQPQNSKGCVAAEVAMGRPGSLLEVKRRSTATTTPSTDPCRFYRGTFGRRVERCMRWRSVLSMRQDEPGGAAVAEIVMDQVSKIFPDGTKAVDSLDLDVGDGEFIVLVGPSGCGKTTALRMVAGLESISEGTLRIGEKVMNQVPPKERDIAMVFQNYALYPHMTVYDNMAFGLKLRESCPRTTSTGGSGTPAGSSAWTTT